jgi:hypothetical protein
MLLVCMLHGPGTWSVDAWIKQRFFMPDQPTKEKS